MAYVTIAAASGFFLAFLGLLDGLNEARATATAQQMARVIGRRGAA